MPTAAQKIALERKALMDLMDAGAYKVPNRRIDENLLLATWNIAQFSNKKSSRAIQYMADIVERFDIVAIQEVKTDLRGLKRLIDLLPGQYDFLVSDATGNHERFAYVYDRRTVSTTGHVFEFAFNVPGNTHRGYQLHRMPYGASFQAGRFDFTILNVHIFEGSGAPGGLDAREEEIRELAKAMAKRSKKDKDKVFDRDIFIVGDFNIQKDGDRFFEALEGESFEISPNIRTNYSQNKSFDKIAWVGRPGFSFSKAGVVPFGKVLFMEAGKKCRKEVSDHLPLWAEFKINKLSQQLDRVIRL